MKANIWTLLAAALIAVAMAGCATHAPAPDYQALVASPDRSDGDRTNDVRRKALQFLTFMDVRPGMAAADISAGGGVYNGASGPRGRRYRQGLRAQHFRRPARRAFEKARDEECRGGDRAF